MGKEELLERIEKYTENMIKANNKFWKENKNK